MWWKENQKKSVFVPGKGISVPGVDGYFDANGEPIAQQGVEQASFTPASGARSTFSTLTSPESYQPNQIVNTVKTAVGQGPDEALAKTLYAEAEAHFRRQEYDEAADKFSGAAKRWPDSTLEHDAMFWHAESLFFADRYPASHDAIGMLVKKYPGTRYLDIVMAREYAMARYWQEKHQADPKWPTTPNLTDETQHYFDTLGHALRAYEHIRLSDPTGRFADDALLATANAHFLRGAYGEADYYYGLLRSEYPKSEHQKTAHLLGLQSKMLKYQGPDYDGAALEEAEELAERTLVQFSAAELGDDRDRLYTMRAEVEAQQALRLWNRAEFYANGAYYAAARHYYDQIIKDYPTTRMAEESRRMIASHQGLPDRPTPPLEMMASAIGIGNRAAPTGSSSSENPTSNWSLWAMLWPDQNDPPPSNQPAQSPAPIQLNSSPPPNSIPRP
jgi:outer membrane protein assembly factor BamD (BamD/ComL family)